MNYFVRVTYPTLIINNTQRKTLLKLKVVAQRICYWSSFSCSMGGGLIEVSAQMKLAEGKWQIEERSGGGGSVGSLPVPGWLAWAVWRWPYMFFMELPWHGLSCWCTFFSSEWHMSSVTTNIHIRVRHQSQCHWKMPSVVLNLKWPCFIEAAPMKLNAAMKMHTAVFI